MKKLNSRQKRRAMLSLVALHLVALMMMAGPLYAQHGSGKPLITPSVVAGLAIGENEPGAMFQLIGTHRFGKVYAGVGAGYDAYLFKGFPLFAHLQYQPFKRPGWMAYLQGGYNLPVQENIAGAEWGLVDEHWKGGYFGDAGLGYGFAVSATHQLIFAAGYSRKSTSQIRTFAYPCGIDPCPEQSPTFTTRKWELGRIVVRVVFSGI